MANPVFTRNQKCFPVLETTFGTAVTPVGTNACLITQFATPAQQPIIPRPDKTGSLGEILGIPGRKSASWNASMSMAGNGAAGVKPDCDVLLQLIFGKAVTISAGVSATYGLADLSYSASIWHYNDPQTAAQYLAVSAVGTQLKITGGGDVPMLEFSGQSLWTFDTDQLADVNMDTVGSGGILTWTTEPTPTVNGKPPAGFVGAITLDGNTYTTLRSFSITLAVPRSLPLDVFNSYYGAAPVPGLRTVSIDMNLYDDDSTNLKSLKQKAMVDKTQVNLVFQIGTVAGNRWTFTCKNCLLPAYTLDQGSDRRALAWSGIKAYDTTIGADDALALVIT
jgi:hypothetical protein